MESHETTTLLLASEPIAESCQRAMLAMDWPAKIIRYESMKEALDALNRDRPTSIIIELDGDLDDTLLLLSRARDVFGGQRKIPAIVLGHDAPHAARAFEMEVSDFLLVPVDSVRLMTAIEKLRDAINHDRLEALNVRLQRVIDAVIPVDGRRRSQRVGSGARHVERLGVRVGNRWVVVRAEDIQCITGAGVYVRICVIGQSYLLRSTMAEVESKLDPRKFVRIHRSTIVNTDHLKEVCPHRSGEYVVVMDDGSRLKASRSYGARIREIVDAVG